MKNELGLPILVGSAAALVIVASLSGGEFLTAALPAISALAAAWLGHLATTGGQLQGSLLAFRLRQSERVIEVLDEGLTRLEVLREAVQSTNNWEASRSRRRKALQETKNTFVTRVLPIAGESFRTNANILFSGIEGMTDTDESRNNIEELISAVAENLVARRQQIRDATDLDAARE